MLDFTRQYLRLRQRGNWLVMTLNLVAIAAIVFTPAASWLARQLAAPGADQALPLYLLAPLYCAILFIAHSILNFPFEFWYGYALDRQFGLAREGARFWARAWMIGLIQHGFLFVVGSCIILAAQTLMPKLWIAPVAGAWLMLFILSRYLETDLLPVGLFQFDPLKLPAGRGSGLALPPIFVFGHIDQRDRVYRVMGLGPRRVLLLSRPAAAQIDPHLIERAINQGSSRRTLRDTLLAWGFAVVALILADRFIVPAHVLATPVYIAWLALFFSVCTACLRGVELALRLMTRSATPPAPRAHGNLISDHAPGSLLDSFSRLSMWLPNVLCRCGIERLGRPAGWFIPALAGD